MNTLTFLIGLITETAHAISLAELGLGRATSNIFAGACAIIEYCDGSNGIAVMTGVVINAVLWAIGGAATVVILYASLRMVSSGGNDETVRKAWKQTIFYAVLGLILTILADVILNYIFAKVAGISAM